MTTALDCPDLLGVVRGPWSPVEGPEEAAPLVLGLERWTTHWTIEVQASAAALGVDTPWPYHWRASDDTGAAYRDLGAGGTRRPGWALDWKNFAPALAPEARTIVLAAILPRRGVVVAGWLFEIALP